MDLISSRNNPKIKQVRSLKERKARLASGLAVVEGIFPVGEAVAAAQAGRISIDCIFYAPQLLKSVFASGLVTGQAAQGVPCFATSEEVFASIADKDNPQGILALVKPVSYSLDTLNPQNAPWCVALVSPQDPGNVGTVLRTLDAVDADCLLLLESGLDAYQPGVVRASMGIVFWKPVVNASFTEFASWRRGHGYRLYGTSAHAQEDYRRVAYRKPCILLLGSEREGLTADQRQDCDILISLPMAGRATSLNLAVAAGVLLYEMRNELGDSLAE
jgi:TrmH family RNA methyltransferase